MAAPAAKTSSSSLPCRTSPSLKKSEICDPMRRSFNGNPFTKPSIVTNPRSFNPNTPANSPSDFPRRYSTGRESVASFRDSSDKENSKDQNTKPTRVRSPAPSKGTKNFMSPTISAASKMNASPRKKILVEINEPGRSSVSFSDVKGLIMEDHESTPEVALKKKKVSFSDVKSIIMDDETTPEIGLNQREVSFSDVKSIVMEDNVSASETSLKDQVSFANVESVVTEDNESAPVSGLGKKNFEVPRDSSSSNYENEEPLKNIADFEYKESTNDSDPLPETVTEEKDSVNVDPTFKISPRVNVSPSCPVLAPLDADPSMPPYDPKTNYLSPRPQFLHYRPNPRIDLYRDREGKHLEEQFASESYSDTDVSEENQSECSERESEDISSEKTFKEEDEEDEEELQVSEPAPDMVEKRVKGKRTSEPRFSTRSKFISFLLVLAFAYLSIQAVNSPAFSPSRLEELSLLNFHVPPEVSAFAGAKFDMFTQNLQRWSVSFWSYVSNIISSSREMHKLGPFQYANLSLLIEHDMSKQNQMFDHSVPEPARERDAGTELFHDKYREIEAKEEVDVDDYNLEDQEDEAYKNSELVLEEEPDEVQHGAEAMIESDHLEAKQTTGDGIIQFDSEDQSNVNLNDQPSKTPQATEIQPDVSKSGVAEGDDLNEIAETGGDEVQHGVEATIEPDHLEAKEIKGDQIIQLDPEDQSNVNLSDQPSRTPQGTEIQPDMSKSGVAEGDDLKEIGETVKEEEKSLSSDVVTSTITGSEDQFLTKNGMAFSLLVLCLLVAAAFLHTKRGKPSMPGAVAAAPIISKKSRDSAVSVSSMDTIRERLSSRNWQTEVDMANESCPSEMSSCQKTSSSSSSYSKKGPRESNEYRSQKTRKNNRRESLASSDYSMGSPSYGSFTTYEKLPSKHGGDEEIVTPVRRSSRIKKQVTSP